MKNGSMAGTQDGEFRAINNRWPVFAFSHDVGNVTTSTMGPIVLSVGHVRDPVVQYITANNQMQERAPYFATNFSSTADVVSTGIRFSMYHHGLIISAADIIFPRRLPGCEQESKRFRFANSF